MTEEEKQRNKKKIIGGLRFIVRNSYKILNGGKKFIVVVLIPTLEIISNILSMIDHDDDNFY